MGKSDSFFLKNSFFVEFLTIWFVVFLIITLAIMQFHNSRKHQKYVKSVSNKI